MSTNPNSNAENSYDEEFRRTEKLQAKLCELFPDGPDPLPGHLNNPIAVWSQAQLEAARNALEIERAKGGG